MKDDREIVRDDSFDTALEDLIGPPPDVVVKEITPWRKGMNHILAGIALTAVNLNFWMLNYILPLAGVILLLLGFRALRRENGWFRAGWIAAMLRVGWALFTLALNAYAVHEEVFALPVVTALGWGSLALNFLTPVFLWKGLRAVQDKAGISGGAGAAVGLVFWYAVLYILGMVKYSGWLGVILLMVSFVLVLRSIYRLSKAPDEVGYAVRAAPVRVGDGGLAAAVCAVLAAAIACGYLFFLRYPMDWREVRPTTDSEVTEVRAHLLELGFPEEVLNDLTEEDILACRDALRVVCDSEDHAVNSGRRVEETETRPDGSTVHHSSVAYDVKELRLTHIAVELPGEQEEWKIFHHFLWTVNPGFRGTESMKVWPAYSRLDGWAAGSGFTGQVLYDRDGRTWAAPYHTLGEETYTTNSIFWGEQTSTDAFAAFSLPNEGERQRGYVSYSILEAMDGWILNAWVDYTHQDSLFQYPVSTATQWQMSGGWNGRPFRTVQDALQFYPSVEEEEQPPKDRMELPQQSADRNSCPRSVFRNL